MNVRRISQKHYEVKSYEFDIVLFLQAYNTMMGDNTRYNQRIVDINSRPNKSEWTPKPWPPKSKSMLLGKG